MRVSIAMCTYNGARFLPYQLQSLTAQERLPEEVVICDDCSSDNTIDILKSFAIDAPFPVHIHQNKSRLGSTKNFEKAIALCLGDLIFLCDQDDLWSSQKVSLTAECLINDEQLGLVFSDAEVVDENAESLGYTLWESLRLDADLRARIRTSEAFEILNFRTLVTGATMAFRKEFKDLVLPIPDDIPLIHDGWIALMISLCGRLGLIDRPLMKYRQHTAQQLGTPHKGQPPPPSTLLINSQRQYDFASEISKLEAARQRFEATKPRFEPIPSANLGSRLKHLTNRVEIKSQRLSGLPTALGELFSGRYHQYSNGFYSMMKDLAN